MLKHTDMKQRLDFSKVLAFVEAHIVRHSNIKNRTHDLFDGTAGYLYSLLKIDKALRAWRIKGDAFHGDLSSMIHVTIVQVVRKLKEELMTDFVVK
jgi:hypothetical protein